MRAIGPAIDPQHISIDENRENSADIALLSVIISPLSFGSCHNLSFIRIAIKNFFPSNAAGVTYDKTKTLLSFLWFVKECHYSHHSQ